MTSVVLWHWLGKVGFFAEDYDFDGVGEVKATVGQVRLLREEDVLENLNEKVSSVVVKQLLIDICLCL